jgi:hypothetical protein
MPLPDEIAKAHDRSDVDSSVFALHHTLGTKAGQAAAGNHKHAIGGGGFHIVGPWGTAAPAGGTSGVAFTVDVAGTYELEAQASGYIAAGSGNLLYTAWVDGNNMTSRNFFFNTAAVHMTGPRLVWTQYLTVGTHYFYMQFAGSSDSNDALSFTWSKISDSGILVPPVQTTYDTGWIEVGITPGAPAFQNGWTHYDQRTARFRKINGIVYLGGIVKSGTVGPNFSIFTLPVGFRPTNRNFIDNNYACISNGAFGSLGVSGNGAVALESGSNIYADLCCASFPADN